MNGTNLLCYQDYLMCMNKRTLEAYQPTNKCISACITIPLVGENHAELLSINIPLLHVF